MADAVHGAQELKRKLRGLKKTLGTPAQRRALRAGAKPMVKEVKRRLPKSLRKGISAVNVKRFEGAGTPVVVQIGPTRGARGDGNRSFVAAILERGAQPHPIRATTAGLSRRGNAGRRRLTLRAQNTDEFLGPQVQHPGFESRPVFAPAFRATKEEAVRQVVQTYRRIVEQAVL